MDTVRHCNGGRVVGICADSSCPFYFNYPKRENCWFPDRRFSLEEIASVFGLRKQRIERIEKAALGKIRENAITYLTTDNPKRYRGDWVRAK